MFRILLVSDLGNNIGLGHYSRARILKREILSCYKKKVKFSNLFVSDEKINFIKTIKKKNLDKKLIELLERKKINKLIFNVSRFLEPKLYNLIVSLSQKKNLELFAIDGFIKKSFYFKKIWIPNIALKQKTFNKKKIKFGWDKILIDSKIERKKKSKKRNFLILIGGTDRYKIGERLPRLLKNNIKNFNFYWVRGPFAKKPSINKDFKNFKIIQNKLDLKRIYSKMDFAFVVFGVTFFEVLKNKIPHVLFFHKNKTEDMHLIKKLIDLKFNVCGDYLEAIKKIKELTENYKKSKKQISNLSKLINFKKRNMFIKNFIN